MDELGARLRLLRRERGLSQRTLTAMIGLSAHSNLADYESGRRVPPQDIVEACERALGVATGELSDLRRTALVERATVAEPRRTENRFVRRRTRVVIAAGVVTVALLGWLGLHLIAATPSPRPMGAAMGVSSCDRTAVILDSVAVLAKGDNPVGTVSLRYSPSCSLAWARFIPTAPETPSSTGVTLSVHRVSDGATTVLHLGQVVAAESDPLLTVPGCVYAEATVTFAGGAVATGRTTCRQS